LAVRFASGISFDQETRNLCNNYATNLRDITLDQAPESSSGTTSPVFETLLMLEVVTGFCSLRF
jgi:hypothetical protein